MKKILTVEGKITKSYYDEEYYNVVGESGTKIRVRIDRWNKETGSHEDLPELIKFEGKKVKIVVTFAG